MLVAIWEDVLMRKPISVNESFFSLGGDSIKALQVIARLGKSGYQLSMRSFLLNPTVMELASKLTEFNCAREERSVAEHFSLSPIQQWFFSNQSNDCEHFNQGAVLLLNHPLSVEDLKAIFRELVLHHDLLRGSFPQKDKKRVQVISEAADVSIQEYHLSLPIEEDRTYTNILEDMHTGMDVTNGPLWKVAKVNSCGQAYVIIIIHHLIIDAVSWYILLEDFDLLCRQHRCGDGLKLSLKTDSYRKWIQDLDSYARAGIFQKECDYWQEVTSRTVSRIESIDSAGKWKDSLNTSIAFDLKTTEELIDAASKCNIALSDLLLAVLRLSIHRTFGLGRYAITLEGHGREELAGINTNVSRTLGWFTSLFPVTFAAPAENDWRKLIAETRSALNEIPNKGIGYNIWKYLTEKGKQTATDENLRPQILFNYLGHIRPQRDDRSFSLISTSPGRSIGDQMQRTHAWEITSVISDKHLQLSVIHGLKGSKQVKVFLDHFKSTTKELAEYRRRQPMQWNDGGDFTYKGLTNAALNELHGKFQNAIEDVCPLTPLQHGILFHSLLKGNTAYFSQFMLTITGRLEIGVIRDCMRILSDRHQILRTVFAFKGMDTPVQIVTKSLRPVVYHEDVRNRDHEGGERHLIDLVEQDRRRSFDLQAEAPMRMTVVEMQERQFALLWSFHHIIMDGWSFGILCVEFIELYNSAIKGTVAALHPVQPYSAYLRWLFNREENKSRAFWMKYLQGYESHAYISGHHQQVAAERELKRLEYSLDISAELTDSLKQIAAERDVTLNTLVQTAWGVLLGRYADSHDVIFGSVVSGRSPEVAGVESIVGLFINTIPVRIRFKKDESFSAVLGRVQSEQIDCVPYHYNSLSEIQELAGNKALFDHIIVFENYPLDKKVHDLFDEAESVNRTFELSGVEVSENNNYDFSFTVTPGAGLQFIFKYSELVEPSYVRSIARHLHVLLMNIAADPDAAIGSLEIFDQTTVTSLVYDHNSTEATYSTDESMISLFRRQAVLHPDHVAVVFNCEYLTYGELGARANRCAHMLASRGISANDIVGLLMEPSLELVIAMWGVLKSGAAFLPIDPQFPVKRIAYMTADAAVSVMICNVRAFSLKDLQLKCETVCLKDRRLLAPYPDTEPAPWNEAGNAYVIYTSGSSGLPKGTVITHANLANYALWHSTELGLSTDYKSILTSSYAFDLGYSSLFPSLISGATVHLVKENVYLLPGLLLRYVYLNNITTLKMTPGHFSSLVNQPDVARNHFSSVRWILLGGEQVAGNDVRKILRIQPRARVMNHYGPTETTIGCISCTVDAATCEAFAERPSIGKPIGNTCAYVLNSSMQLVPYGVPGELYISGQGVGAGYLNRPDLTSRKFTDDPYRPGYRMYKTGDLVKRAEDGALHFLGRTDSQVKVRGYRVELNEVKRLVLAYPSVTDAVIMLRDVGGDNKQLCCYLIVSHAISTADLKTYLATMLPAYMVPVHYTIVQSFPLTGNGKVNLGALPAPAPATDFVTPRNVYEIQLSAIWESIFSLEKGRVGIKSDFFALGGHSLKAMMLSNMIARTFKVEMSIAGIYQNPVLEDMAALIASGLIEADGVSEIPLADPKHAYSLSIEQKRLYVAQQLDPESILYNISYALIISGHLNKEKLNTAFQRLTDRHESLRTSFQTIEQEPYQVIAPSVDFAVEFREGIDADLDELIAGTIRPFVLDSAPLMRVTVIRTGNARHLLIVDMHHIISDAISSHILIRDFLRLYEGEALLPLKIQYKDYAEWQNNPVVQEWIGRKEQQFKATSDGSDSLAELFPSVYHEGNGSAIGRRVSFEIPDESHRFADRTANELNISVQSVYLAAYYILLAQMTGRQHLTIYNTYHGRYNRDMEDVVGFFVKILPVRAYAGKYKSFTAFVREIDQHLLRSYDFQMCRYEFLKDRGRSTRHQRAELFPYAMFDFQKSAVGVIELDGMQISPYDHQFQKSPFPLMLQVIEDTERSLAFTYQTSCFSEEGITELISSLNTTFRQVSQKPHITLDRIFTGQEALIPVKEDNIEFRF